MPQNTPASQSSYYPPRAGRTRGLRRLFSSLRAARHLERIHLPRMHVSWRMLAAVAVPGLAFFFSGPRLVARLIWIAIPLLFLVFLAGLGTLAAELAFGLMIGTHVLSVSHLLRPLMIRCRLPLQLVLGVVVFVAISLVLYNPMRGWFNNHVAMPLRINGQTVVINPRANPSTVQRGDVVAYHIPASGGRGVIVQQGVGFRPVWGLPEDTVVFGNGVISLNGEWQPLPDSSQEWGSLVVPEECWFIWPELSIRNHGRADAEVTRTLRQLALVPQSRFAGRAYGWWFFRAQGLR